MQSVQKSFTVNFLCTHTAADNNEKLLHWLFQPGMLYGNVCYSSYLHSIICFLLLVKIKTLAKLSALCPANMRPMINRTQEETISFKTGGQLFCTWGPYFLGSGKSDFEGIHFMLLVSQVLASFFPGSYGHITWGFFTLFSNRLLTLLFSCISCITAGTCCPGSLWESISGRVGKSTILNNICMYTYVTNIMKGKFENHPLGSKSWISS